MARYFCSRLPETASPKRVKYTCRLNPGKPFVTCLMFDLFLLPKVNMDVQSNEKEKVARISQIPFMAPPFDW